MSGTPDWLKARVRDYYQATNERSYLANWSGQALSFHYGLSDERTASLDEAHLASNAYLADHLGIGPRTRVLDAGCGVGGTSIWLAKERGARVVGVTLDPQQVDLANRFARERGAEDATSFHVMDYMATTFAEGSFDVALNLESLCHCIDVRAYFEHLRALLADGGRYGCMEFFVGERDERPDLVREVREGWAMPAWSTMSAVAGALRAAGFEEVEAIDLTARVRRSAEQMMAMANNTRLVTKLHRAIAPAPADAAAGAAEEVFDGHVRGAIAACEGLLSGGVSYGFVRGVRPRR